MKSVGALYSEQHCEFTVWAPQKSSMILHIVYPDERSIPMNRDEMGYFTVTLHDIWPGTKYYFNPDGTGDYPDPASFYQADDVHGPSTVIDHHNFLWNQSG